jgi:hypothetical protein
MEQSLGIEGLLMPRFKVVLDYPGSIFELNTILCPSKGNTLTHGDEEGDFVGEINLSRYPEIFKPLNWWEVRDISAMPKYISYISLTLRSRIYGEVTTSEDNFYKARHFMKVDKWAINDRLKWYYNDNTLCTLGHTFLPATEEEYNIYILERNKV